MSPPQPVRLRYTTASIRAGPTQVTGKRGAARRCGRAGRGDLVRRGCGRAREHLYRVGPWARVV